eukprot:scaffold92802_cov65-Attheya_sp.AAC.1
MAGTRPFSCFCFFGGCYGCTGREMVIIVSSSSSSSPIVGCEPSTGVGYRYTGGTFLLLLGWAVLLATRDATTPLIIVSTAAALNVVGDYLFCAWPFRWGCAGAAAATSMATLLSSGLLLKSLHQKKLLPKVRWPKRKELASLSEFTGPLLAITITRLVGFVAMQKRAMTLGLQPLAAYQLCINVVTFFLLFAEPLSQLSQTKLPALVDADDGDSILANLHSILTLGLGAS